MRTVVLQLVLCLAVSYANAQLPDASPPVVRFSPSIDVYPQNFSIAVDSRDHVFLGNSDGVVVFDGEAWQLTELPNREIVRSLAFDGADRIYVGGFDAFGYLERDQFGRHRYTELSHLFAEDLGGEAFADIWSIEISEHGVFFVGLKHLFHYKPVSSETSFWQHTGSFGPVTAFQGEVLLQWRGQGIKAFDGDGWRLIDHPTFDRDFLTALLPMGDEIIIVSSDNKWFRYDGSAFTVIKSSDQIPFKPSVTHAFVANEAKIGLTTQLGHIVFYDLATEKSEVYKVSSGFIPAAVMTSAGAVLAADDLGFVSLIWPARWKLTDGNAGLAGSISAIRLHENNLYVLSSSGAFMKQPESERFQRLAWTDYEAWDMLVLEEGEILFADSYEIKLISANDEIKSIDSNTTARVFKRSAYHNDTVYVGTEYGLQVLKRGLQGWQVVATLKMNNLTVTHIVESSPDDIWIGSDRGGIHKLHFDEVGGKITNQPIGSEHGLEGGDHSLGTFIYEINDEVIASTSDGIFRFNGEKFERDDLHGLTRLSERGRTIKLANVNGDIWAYYYDRLYRFNGEWTEEDLTGLNKGGMTALEAVDGTLLVGALGSILTYDGMIPAETGYRSSVSLTGVIMTEPGAVAGARRLPLTRIQLSTANERLTLQFSLTDFVRPDQVRFRSRLSPIENTLSRWSDSGQQSFVDLKPGNYTLQMEARDSRGAISSLEVPIQVHPQWFETTLFRGGLFGLVLLLGFVAMRFFANRQSRLLARERDVLEQRVAERTRALESANQQLEKMAHLDGLTQIPNRRRLDSYLEDVKLQCVERGRVMAVALLDVDFFKQFNDAHGHQAGDSLLVDLAKLFSRNLRRAEDLVARYGGEEFLVVLPGADTETALRVIEGMRVHVESSELEVTVSAGLHVVTPDENTTVEAMVAKADAALYIAKDGGRNRVVVG